MGEFDDEGGSSAKRDRGARLLRVATVRRPTPTGSGSRTSPSASAISRPDRLPRPRRARGRDRDADLGGRRALGILEPTAFLPPLKLTTSEAMAVVLAARLMVRYADKYDPDLASAFEKLGRGPAGAARRARRADARRPASAPGATSASADHVHALTRAWAERRVVDDRLRAGALRGPDAGDPPGARSGRTSSSRRSRRTPSTSSAATRRATRSGRSRSSGSGTVSVTPRTLRAARAGRRRGDAPAGLGHHRRPAAGRGRPPLRARASPTASRETTWHPTQQVTSERRTARCVWRATVARHDRDPAVDPVVGRRGRGPRAGRPAGRRAPRPIGGRSRALPAEPA